MNSTAQTAAIFGVLIGVFLWLGMSGLTYYSPQLAGMLVLSYFIARYIRKKNFIPLNTAQSTPEFALVTGSILLLIGSTGNIDSLFFPLAYLHLFFLTMSLKPVQSVFLCVSVVLFHYGLQMQLTPNHISTLLSLFLMLIIFLFAKKQYEERQEDEVVVERQELKLAEEKSNAILFVTTVLQPKIESLLRLSDYPEANKEVIQRQLILLSDAVEKLLEVEISD